VPTDYVRAWNEPGAPRPAPYPYQLRLVGQWRQGGAEGVDRVSHWAGQSAALATDEPAGEKVARMWRDASTLLA
jgi:nitronate monooxygenase